MTSPNNTLYDNLCSSTVSCNKRFLVESHRNTSKHQKALGSTSELLILRTSLTFLWNTNTNFVEVRDKTFLSADFPLYKLYNKHIQNLFHDIGHSLPSETTSRTVVLNQGSMNPLGVRRGTLRGPYDWIRFSADKQNRFLAKVGRLML